MNCYTKYSNYYLYSSLCEIVKINMLQLNIFFMSKGEILWLNKKSTLRIKKKVIILYQNSLKHLSKTNLIDRKSTRLNSSHVSISYAVFCLNIKNEYNDLA